jgi:amino acid permease
VHDDDFLKVPQHIIDQDMILTKVPGDTDLTGKHGSLTTIFSVWNAMVGTGLVTIPWAFSQSGLVYGIVLTFISFVVSFTTQYFVMQTAGTDLDFTETLKKQFGKFGWNSGMFIFIGMLTVPIILYTQLLAQTLFPILMVLFQNVGLVPHDDNFGSLDPDFS